MRVAVIGAGVSGMSCAVRLSELADVTVFYAAPWSQTTSALATAMWHVYLVDPGDHQVLEWARLTMERMLEIAASAPSSGVSRALGVELYRTPMPVPAWASIAPHFRMLADDEIARFPGVAAGYEVETVLADMLSYLPWLEDQARSAGVEFIQERYDRLELVPPDYSIVVNCSGLGARELVHDRSVRPVKGQYLVLPRKAVTPMDYVGDDENPAGMAYVVPRTNDVLVGGTEEYDVADPAFTQDVAEMLHRSSDAAPWLSAYSGDDVLDRVVGFRPYRASGVRLETTTLEDARVAVHNYGHGGSGFSLSWGCAETVRQEVARYATSD